MNMITPLAPGASHAEFARYYTRAGFGLVHVPQGKKGPIHQGWQRNALSDPDQAIQYWTQHPHDNMGALLWKSRLVSLDIDNVKLAQQALAAVGIDLECLLNAPPIPRIEGNPKKAKLLFRLPEGVDLQSHKLRLQGREGCTVLELRAGRHQDLLPPSEHPDTGKPYRWLRAPWEVEEIPVPPVKLLELWQNWPKFERDMRAAIEGHPEPDVLAKAINEYETFQGHSNGEWNRVREMICQQLSVKELLSQMGEQERGKNKYLCLFHSEKSPSFWLHETLWICAHGGAPVGLTGPSGYSVGDVIDLYQWANSLDSPGKATTALARELRIDLRVGNGGVTHVPSDNPKTGGSLSNSPVDERIGQTVSTPTWKEPESLPTILPAVEPFDAKLLPEAFRPWVEDAAERMQCPPDFMAVSCMVALAAVVGRQIGIRPKQKDDWLVVPNLWGAAVGRPGTLKTAALQEPLNALELLEARARNRYEAERKGYEAAQLVADERKKIKREEIRKALKVDKNPEQLALEAVKEEAEPGRQRYVVNDTTIEKLGEILNANPRGVLLFRDELTGFLKSLDKNDREGDRSFYLEAWNGSTPHTYDRIGRGTVDIQAACVSILGGIQPGPLSHYVRRMAQGDANNDGLLQRFQLAVWPD